MQAVDGTSTARTSPGYRVLHTVAHPTNPCELLAAVDHPVWGSHIYRSLDGGARWASLDAVPQHPPQRYPQSLHSIWHLAWSPDGTRLYAGVDPAGLVRQRRSRSELARRAVAERACDAQRLGAFARSLRLHSINIDRHDPAHIVVAVSAGGVYRSEDGGASWYPSNVGVRAENLPERFPVAGHNVHRVVMHPLDGQRLYRQCYSGTYRSDDGGSSWSEITDGLPSDFGYALACDPFDADYGVPDTRVEFAHARGRGRQAAGISQQGRRPQLGVGVGGTAAGTCVRYGIARGPRCARAAAASRLLRHVVRVTCSSAQNRGDDWELLAEFLPRVLSVRFVATQA